MIGDASLKKLITDQTTEWGQMMEKHRKEEWEFQKSLINESKEEVKRILPLAQADQVKLLQIKHDK